MGQERAIISNLKGALKYFVGLCVLSGCTPTVAPQPALLTSKSPVSKKTVRFQDLTLTVPAGWNSAIGNSDLLLTAGRGQTPDQLFGYRKLKHQPYSKEDVKEAFAGMAESPSGELKPSPHDQEVSVGDKDVHIFATLNRKGKLIGIIGRVYAGKESVLFYLATQKEGTLPDMINMVTPIVANTNFGHA